MQFQKLNLTHETKPLVQQNKQLVFTMVLSRKHRNTSMTIKVLTGVVEVLVCNYDIIVYQRNTEALMAIKPYIL